MKRLLFHLTIFVLVTFISSCSKDDSLPETPIVGLGGDTWVKGPIDNYITENFTKPYNIEVKYKWDPYETNYAKDITPVMENKVIPVLETIKAAWIDPYETIIGKSFLQKFCPKQLAMFGSAEYNSDGTITLGEAETGKKITLMVVNDFDKKNLPEVTRLLHTMHHEFAHILHQNIMFPREFRQLNPEWYTATWYNTEEEDANAQGLVTSYAKAAPEEDFVETVSFLLVEGQDRFDELIQSNPGKAATILKRKEEIIIGYYHDAYNIDFKALQNQVKNAIAEITK